MKVDRDGMVGRAVRACAVADADRPMEERRLVLVDATPPVEETCKVLTRGWGQAGTAPRRVWRTSWSACTAAVVVQ